MRAGILGSGLMGGKLGTEGDRREEEAMRQPITHKDVVIKLLLLAVVMTGACFAYRPTALAPEPGSRVRVVFTTAIAVITSPIGTDTAHRVYPGVLEASGVIRAAASDTVALRLGELRTAAGPVPHVSDQVAMLPTAQIARIEQRRFQAGTTLLAGVGVFALAATTFLLLLIAEITHAF